MTYYEWIAAAAHVANIVALLVGGIWTYRIFIKRRQRLPRARISHEVHVRTITEQRKLLTVLVTVSNLGEVLLSIRKATTRVLQVFPLDVDESTLEAISRGAHSLPKHHPRISWKTLGERKFKVGDGLFEVEPGESDQLVFDFILDNVVETVHVFTFVPNESKPDKSLGWCLTTVHDLRPRSTRGGCDAPPASQ